MVSPLVAHPEGTVERPIVINNKILAIGRMACVFVLLRYGIFAYTLQSDKSLAKRSQRRSYRSSGAYLVLTSCHTMTERSFSVRMHAYHLFSTTPDLVLILYSYRRTSEIQNEHLSPELFDVEETKVCLARAQSFGPLSTTLADTIKSPVSPSPPGVSGAMDHVWSRSLPSLRYPFSQMVALAQVTEGASTSPSM